MFRCEVSRRRMETLGWAEVVMRWSFFELKSLGHLLFQVVGVAGAGRVGVEDAALLIAK
jgi:hypothetical protein